MSACRALFFLASGVPPTGSDALRGQEWGKGQQSPICAVPKYSSLGQRLAPPFLTQGLALGKIQHKTGDAPWPRMDLTAS